MRLKDHFDESKYYSKLRIALDYEIASDVVSITAASSCEVSENGDATCANSTNFKNHLINSEEINAIYCYEDVDLINISQSITTCNYLADAEDVQSTWVNISNNFYKSMSAHLGCVKMILSVGVCKGHKRVQTTVVQRPSQQFGRSTLSSSCNLLFVQASKTHFLSFNASDNDYSARTPVTFTSQRVTCPWFSLKPIVNEFNVIHNNYG